jgi:hypothetical protein
MANVRFDRSALKVGFVPETLLRTQVEAARASTAQDAVA